VAHLGSTRRRGSSSSAYAPAPQLLAFSLAAHLVFAFTRRARRALLPVAMAICCRDPAFV
jgi:hypothetical protein